MEQIELINKNDIKMNKGKEEKEEGQGEKIKEKQQQQQHYFSMTVDKFKDTNIKHYPFPKWNEKTDDPWNWKDCPYHCLWDGYPITANDPNNIPVFTPKSGFLNETKYIVKKLPGINRYSLTQKDGPSQLWVINQEKTNKLNEKTEKNEIITSPKFPPKIPNLTKKAFDLGHKKVEFLSFPFCSFSCAKSYILSQKGEKMQERLTILSYIARRYYGIEYFKHILPAPPRETLIEYGGVWNIKQFREKSIFATACIRYPPFVFAETFIEENNVKKKITNQDKIQKQDKKKKQQKLFEQRMKEAEIENESSFKKQEAKIIQDKKAKRKEKENEINANPKKKNKKKQDPSSMKTLDTFF